MGTGQHLVLGDWSDDVFSCKCIFSWTVGLSNFKLCSGKGHMLKRVLGNISCDLDPKVNGQMMYLFVNASSPKLFDIATLKFAGT